jgi:hypothetical protein
MTKKGYFSKSQFVFIAGSYDLAVLSTVKDLFAHWQHALGKHSQRMLHKHQITLIRVVTELVSTSSWKQLNILSSKVWSRTGFPSTLYRLRRTHTSTPRSVFTKLDHAVYSAKWLIPKGLRGFPRITSRTHKVMGVPVKDPRFAYVQNSMLNSWNYSAARSSNFIRLVERNSSVDGVFARKNREGASYKQNLMLHLQRKSLHCYSDSFDFGSSNDESLSWDDDYKSEDW